ncbi:prolyl oligopeptidase family serine peptidase [Streptomyces sp. YIM 98790]|uniref:S9 family peptidase n=1 Tax=Streptomyces sp. YIM 98790 TaxID=2689077 RepID=UPI00140C1E60|nr:prolyl oligopeptidase family serine peptidase [Streptomyces sp. YIM 98790]
MNEHTGLPAPSADAAELRGFPRRFARTRRFSLGAPGQFTVSPDGERVLFLRSASGTDPRPLLWLYRGGRELLLADPAGPSYATDREVRLAAWSRDGALWTVRTTGGEPPRRISAAGPVTDPRPSPDGTRIAYVTGGALHLVRADGTDDRRLTPPGTGTVTHGLPDRTTPGSYGPARGHRWSPDGDALLVTRVDSGMVPLHHLADPADPGTPPRTVRRSMAGTPTAGTSLHLYFPDASGGVRHVPVRLPHAAPGREHPPGAWHAPRFAHLLAVEWDTAGPLITLQSRDQRTVWTLAADPATGETVPLDRRHDPHWVDVRPGTPRRTASGVPVLSRTRGDTRALAVGDALTPEGLEVREVVGTVAEEVFFTANEHTDPTEVHVWSHRPGTGFTRLTGTPGVHTAAVGGPVLVLDSRTPDGQRVTVLRDGRPAGRIAVLTEQPPDGPAPRFLVLGARRLHTRLHLPSWHRPGDGRRLPVLLCPYGGPALQVVTRARAWYTAVCQWFAEHGFAVLAADGRGTPGRGIAWQRALLGDRLTPALDDQIDALHAAAGRHDALDLSRVAIRGWSFSGYLAAGAVLRRPDVFHAAVAGAAPADRRLYDAYGEERYLGHPQVQPEGYARSSLRPRSAGPFRPLLLVHGLADDNVLPVHTLRLSAALLAAGHPHAVLPLPGTGHLVTGEETAAPLLRLELDFLTRALGGSPGRADSGAAAAG